MALQEDAIKLGGTSSQSAVLLDSVRLSKTQ